uniref:Uncharacterized protein n=1 Tax=Erpetoichthys calabaricus TaxID=27687 RepID=A0A8C4T528_ERPCA
SVTLALLLVRLLSRTGQTRQFCATVNACCKEDYGKGPLKFSGSKADPRYWKVEKSLGSSYLRAWWTVLPISILGLVTIFWCFVREEKEVDQKLLTGMQDYWPNSLESVQDGSNESQESIKPALPESSWQAVCPWA